jgi:hypothetical protein
MKKKKESRVYKSTMNAFTYIHTSNHQYMYIFAHQSVGRQLTATTNNNASVFFEILEWCIDVSFFFYSMLCNGLPKACALHSVSHSLEDESIIILFRRYYYYLLLFRLLKKQEMKKITQLTQ